MYFVLYDRNLKSIGEPYVVESWNRIQRATDFDEIKIVGAEIPQSANPFFVVVNDKKGNQLFSGLASTPIIDDKTKKTTITLKDYLTLFNSDIVVDWGSFLGATVGSLINGIFNIWKKQIDVGFAKIECDVSAITNLNLDESVYSFEGKESVLAYTLISDAIFYYDLFVETSLNLYTQTLKFTFKRAKQNSLSIKLKDFGVNTIEKSFGDYNRVTIYSSNFEKKQEWTLTENNNVQKIYDINNDSFSAPNNVVYPVKNRNFVAAEPTNSLSETQAINDAIYDAVMSLAQNRYQENIDLNAQQNKSIVDLTAVDFSYIINVYTNEGEYRALPVGEIETDSKGKHIVRLGHRIQELTQEL